MPLGYSMVRLSWETQRKAWAVAALLCDPTDPFDSTGIVAAIEAALDAYLERVGEREEVAPH
jgi:hypothetical protein